MGKYKQFPELLVTLPSSTSFGMD